MQFVETSTYRYSKSLNRNNYNRFKLKSSAMINGHHMAIMGPFHLYLVIKINNSLLLCLDIQLNNKCVL